MTTSRSRGRSTSIFFRLWTRAPRTVIQSCAITAEIFQENPNSNCTTRCRAKGRGPWHRAQAFTLLGPMPRSYALSTTAIAQPAVLIPVGEVQHQADDEPDAEALPRLRRQPFHDEQATAADSRVTGQTNGTLNGRGRSGSVWRSTRTPMLTSMNANRVPMFVRS